MAFELTTSAFKPGDSIPRRYTCEGEDLSPPLHWTMPPAATKSFVLFADDPDAPVGTWVHWVIYDLPLDLRGLTEGVPTKDRLPNGALQGLNDFQINKTNQINQMDQTDRVCLSVRVKACVSCPAERMGQLCRSR